MICSKCNNKIISTVYLIMYTNDDGLLKTKFICNECKNIKQLKIAA